MRFKISVYRALLGLALFAGTRTSAQDDLPKDYLSKEFHKGRREAARQMMPENSVMVVFAAPTRTFSNDVEYLYHQNPDLYYFTGYKEPHAVLFLFKEPQTSPEGQRYTELFFIQKRNAGAERWTGRRLGEEGVKEKLGISSVYNGETFKDFAIDFSRFDKVIFDRIPEDVAETRGENASLFRLINQFKEKSKLPSDFSTGVYADLDMIRNTITTATFIQARQSFSNRAKTNPAYGAHPLMTEFLGLKDTTDLEGFKQKIGEQRFNQGLFRKITGSLREIKTPEELDLIRKAVEISCNAQNEVMKVIRPDMSELEIQGLHEFVHKKYGAEGVGYGSIIGAGENGCILHYMENTKTKVGRDLILMDVGAEYHGYTADVTRTIPADGKFGPEEKAIYQLVYDAQEAAFKTLKDGSTWALASNAARETIANGLVALGIIKDPKDVSNYYIHGLGHHIGLDVHDKSFSPILKKDMVITIEPGIYIPSNSKCDKKWWGLSVRIEDDALITKDGYELLSHFAPRSIEAIEKMIAEKSQLDGFKLPALKSGQEKKAF
jgi:Xaa-Pro aminopeptidase